MVLPYLSSWAPFRIDALGLVTLIGADEVNKAVGRLVQSRYTKFLPLLGAYLIAADQFTTMASGYHLYNVSDAITTTSLSGWLTRWLSSQDLKMNTTVFEWSVSQKRVDSRNRKPHTRIVIPAIIGFIPIASLITLSVLIADWWSFSNAVSMGLSVLVRWCVVRENINALDQAAVDVCYGRRCIDADDEIVKLLITLDDGRMVTMYAPRGLVIRGFTKTLTILHPRLYSLVQGLGWLFFGIHIIALGQSSLVSQIFTILLLVLSTWATVKGFGCEEDEVSNHITANRLESFPPALDKRIQAFVRLGCSEVEEESLADWGLLPRKINTRWWNNFKEAKEKWKTQSLKAPHSSTKV